MPGETEESTRKQIALSLGWGNTPPLDVLVKDIRAGRMAIAQLQVYLATLARQADGKTVDARLVEDALKHGRMLAQVLP